jgi:methyl-accepting chemotaxis protein
MMFSNVSIGKRLIAAFTLVAAMSAVVGWIGISNSSEINTLSDRMYDRELVGVALIGEANIELLCVGRARANYLLATSQEERQ